MSADTVASNRNSSCNVPLNRTLRNRTASSAPAHILEGVLSNTSCCRKVSLRLAAEAVQGAALTLESVDNVHGRHGLAAGMLGVGHRITDDVLEEDLEN